MSAKSASVPSRVSYGAAAALLLLSALVASLSSRIHLNPFALLVFSPILLLGSALVFVLVDLYATWYIGRKVLQRLVEPSTGTTSWSSPAAADGPAAASTTYEAHRRPIPPLIFTSPAAWSVTQTRASWEAASASSSRAPLPGAPPAVSTSLDHLFDLIIRDFVKKWYSNISDSPAFPNAVERTIRETLGSLVSRVGGVDWSDVLVGQILPLVTDHVDTFRTAEQALRGQDLSTQLTESDELDLFLASRYASETKSGKLHQAVDVASPNSRPAEEAWLSGLVGRVLPFILPERELESGAVRTIVRELVACAVVLPIIEMMSDPDFWNKMIDEKAGDAIRDQKMVTQFREALDAQGSALTSTSIVVSPSPSTTSLPPLPTKRARRTEEISVRTPTKQFESWVRGIGRCSNLADARRLRSDVSGQIRKVRASIDGRPLDELVDGVKVADWLSFIERLYAAKRKADKRIAELGGMGSSRDSMISTPPHCPAPRITLRTILLQPTSLGHFMEFQDRRQRSLRLQFWLLVEGLKDPLEDGADDDGFAAALPPPSAATIATTREDVKMIWEAYFSRSNTLNSNQKYLRTIKAFVERPETDSVSAQELRQVRRAVFATQHDVFVEMEEEDFPEFVKSDLYFKAVADLPKPPPNQLSASTADLPSAGLSPLTRPRAPSNPQTPPTRPPPQHLPRSASPPPRPSSPAPFSKALQPQLTLQRTDTAPPQVTFRAAFDQGRQRPVITRRSGSEGATGPADAGGLFGDGSSSLFGDHPSEPTVRKTSITSLDSGGGFPDRRRSAMADSLEFLMGSPGAQDDFRSPLFGDEGPAEGERRDSGGLEDEDYVQVQTIEAIQDALTSILASDAKGSSQAHHRSTTSLVGLNNDAFVGGRKVSGELGISKLSPTRSRTSTADSPSASHATLTPTDRIPPGSSGKSSVLIEESTRRRHKGVFDDDEDMDEVEPEDLDPDFDPKSIVLAAPGDLQLPVEIARLASTLEKLRNQEAVVGALIRKAELTGIASELKILIKSRESLRREMRALAFQKSQYESQESENKLVPGRTSVTISGTTIGQQADGQSFQLYLVEVHQLASDGTFGSGWIVTRRYSEFATLHAGLRERYVAARSLDFPGKRLVSSYSEGFIEQRRLGLEKYLKALVLIPVICQSNELRSFLSQQNISLPSLDHDTSKRPSVFPGQSLVRSFYRSVTSGIDDMLGTGTSSMMDTIIQRLSQQAAELSGIGGSGVQDEDLVGQLLADGSTNGRSDAIPVDLRVEGGEGLTYFTKPICDLFVTVFELKEKNNWLRRQAILIILQQILGGTIERKFRDAIGMLFGANQLVGYISALKNGLWPGGQLKPKELPRTAVQKAATRDSAHRKLSALMPDVAANLIGRANARQGARRLFAVLQNRRLNRHLIYSVIDEIFLVLFPELAQHPPVGRPLPTSFSTSASQHARRS
ncbi:PXA domain-domain-containing protein [Leucosporidium creatinivorum]|uniref:PXA domain-domain-containing protein n=1 Tax=Leucosporidium creatinivorum TaxID=106004 RepID=A0A1Y2ELG4_9BASI|nr:PXA domain-domain-containing protein [Leucosporidium creatinivorum]